MSLNNQPTPVEIINEINLKAPLASPALTGTPMVNGKNIALTSVNNNFSTAQTITGNLTVEGDITQNGSSYETHAEQIYTKNDYIILRDGATGGLATGAYAGFEAVKYDGTNNGRLVFDNTGTARVGDSGSEAPLTTRAESSAFTNGHLVKWNSTTIGLEDSGKTIGDFVAHTLNSDVSVIGTSKTTESIGTNQLIFPNGAVFSGSAAAAGLVTRGICGVTPPTATGACGKENLYINYDNTTTYNAGRQLVLQAGTPGTHYGNNLYQYAAARGDAVKDWVESKGYFSKSNFPTAVQDYGTLTAAPIKIGYSGAGLASAEYFAAYGNDGEGNRTIKDINVANTKKVLGIQNATNVYYQNFNDNNHDSGWYKIKINYSNPDNLHYMLAFTLRLYAYYKWTDIVISGYNYTDINWYLPKAKFYGEVPSGGSTVHFGYDGTNQLWVAIPAAYYGAIAICNVACGYRPDLLTETGIFSVEYQSTLTGTIQTTFSNVTAECRMRVSGTTAYIRNDGIEP